jgi:hypothetical protein
MKNTIKKIALVFVTLILGFGLSACGSAVEVEGDEFSAEIRRGSRQNPGENRFNIKINLKGLEEVYVSVIQLQSGLTKWAKQLRTVHFYEDDLHFSIQSPDWPECDIDTYSSYQILEGGGKIKFYQLDSSRRNLLEKINQAVDEILIKTHEGTIVPEVY